MRRITLSIITICLALLMIQCRKTEVKPAGNDNPTGEVVEFTLSANSGDEKSVIDGLSVKWSVGDKIYVVDINATSGNGVLGYLSATSDGNTTSEFKGGITAPTAGHQCMFYYVGANTFNPDASGKYTYSVATQNGSLDGIANNFLIMKSTSSVTVTDAMVINHNFGSSSVIFKSLIAISRLNLQDTGTTYAGTVTVKGSYATATLNVKNGTYSPSAGNVTLNNASSDYYMALIPANLTDAQTQNLTFTIEGFEKCKLSPAIAASKYYNKTTPKVVNMVLPTGCLKGRFSISSSKKVCFSKGNLQYLGQAAEGSKWRFADNQYDYFGNGPGSFGNVNLGDAYSGRYNTGSGIAGPNENDADKASARDLFGWGATGMQDTRTASSGYQNNYQPYSTCSDRVADDSPARYINCYGYGPDYYEATDYGLSVEHKSDWGWIPTLPGNTSTEKVWRTLSNDEWGWILGTNLSGAGTECRAASTINGVANARYASVQVCGVPGIMLFPDVFTWPSGMSVGAPSTFNTWKASCNGVDYGTSDFSKLQAAGAVFLPKNGRAESNLGVTDFGNYWSSTSSYHSGKHYAYNILFYSDHSCNDHDPSPRYFRFAVRLVMSN